MRLLLGLGTMALVGLAFVTGRVTAPVDDTVTAAVGAASVDAAPVVHEGAAAPGSAPRSRGGRRPVATDEPAHDHSGGKTASELLKEMIPDAEQARLTEADGQAERIRGGARTQIQNSSVTAARAVAEAIRKERAFLADQALGGTMNMLRTLASADVRPFALVQDPASFAKHFERTTKGADLDGTAHRGHEQPAAGSVLRFPAGTHTLRVSQWGRRGDFPEDIVIEGAGRDATIVRFDEFSANGVVRNLTFRDVTVHAGDNYLTDHRSQEPTTIRMERCRVVGFDIGAGGSVMLAARKAAFYASDTLFEAGYGRNPGSGNLFRVRNGLLARMERCTFTGPFRSVYDTGAAATYVFDTCRFENVRVPLENPPGGVRFVNCEIVEVDAVEIALRRTEWQVSGMLPDEGEAVLVDGVAGKLPEGTTGPVAVAFPAGAHDFSMARVIGNHRGPLLIRGQGREATLLRMNGRISSPVCVIRDATIDVQSSGLFSGPAGVLVLERVRLIGWDSGAGGSTAIDRRNGGIIVVRDSEIIDGFGRAPGRGTAVYLHDGATVRFERSRIDLVGSKFSGYGGTLLLLDTTVNGIDPAEVERLEKSGKKGKFVLRGGVLNARAATNPKESPPRPERRPLSDLNPSWSE